MLALFTLSITTSCHRKHLPEMKFEWSEVVEVPGVPKQILYQRALEWFNQTFNDMRAVIQSQDKEAGTFYAKGYVKFGRIKGTPGETYVYFTVNISVKDGKYKYEFNNFFHEGNIPSHHKMNLTAGGNLESPRPVPTYPRIKAKVWQRIREYTHTDAERTIVKLKEKMAKQSMPETYQ